TLIKALQILPQHDGVDGGKSQVGEEPRVRSDRARILSAVEVGQNPGDIIEDLGLGQGIHTLTSSAKLHAHARWARRAVTTRKTRPDRSARSAVATMTSPVSISTSMTTRLNG